jgi:hypothetical protein
MAKPLINNLKELINIIYPVGSIYMSVNSTSPQTLFGGTWTQLKDRFLLGAGSTYSNGATGGAATHKLTTNEMPSHNHALNNFNGAGNTLKRGVMYGWDLKHGDLNYQNFNNPNIWSADVGGNQAHNNMPPYLVVYMWKRTA